MRRWLRALAVVLPCLVVGTVASSGRKSREVVLPDSWVWQVEATRTATSTAVGAGSDGLPEALSAPPDSATSWTVRGGWGNAHPDGSLSELLRVEAPGDPMDSRVFGIRRFADGELLRIERLAEAAQGGLDSWDPILLGLAPAMPEELSAKRPATRALQWTARLGSGIYLRSNCPAVWTIVPEDSPLQMATGVQGGSELLQHVRYEAHCGLNGRADLESGRPVPFRGEGDLKGDIWWDPKARWVVRHELELTRTVHSRWPGQNGALELIQEQTYTVSASRTPGQGAPEPARRLGTPDIATAIDAAIAEWSACAGQPGPHAVTLEALRDGALAVRAAGLPPDAPSVIPDVGGLPQRGAPELVAPEVESADDLSCWQAALDDVRLPPHDDLGERFDFVLPRSGEAFGSPGIIDRSLPGGRAHFIVSEMTRMGEVAAWLGVI